jgi:hypothetical protein
VVLMDGAALLCSVSPTDIHAPTDRPSAGATGVTENTEFAALTAMIITSAKTGANRAPRLSNNRSSRQCLQFNFRFWTAADSELTPVV